MNPMLASVISLFVQKGWKVTSQTEHSASLEKKASSRTLAIILGAFALLIFFFGNMTVGIIAIIGALVLVALNNATKKSGTAQISILKDGTVQVSSNINSINRVYPPTETGNIVIRTS